MNTRQKGNYGEERAIEHLLTLGYTIISRNYRTRYGEIDCIANDGEHETLVFVEVKCAHGKTAGNPLFWVTKAKQQQLGKMARAYLLDHNINQKRCRFDVIGVCGEKIDHLKNALYL